MKIVIVLLNICLGSIASSQIVYQEKDDLLFLNPAKTKSLTLTNKLVTSTLIQDPIKDPLDKLIWIHGGINDTFWSDSNFTVHTSTTVNQDSWIEKLKSNDKTEKENAQKRLLNELPSLVEALKDIDKDEAELVEEMKKSLEKFKSKKFLKDIKSGQTEAIEKLAAMTEDELAKLDSSVQAEIRTEKDNLDKKIKELIKNLGDDDPETRDKAQEELTKLGMIAFSHLKEALKDVDPERAARALVLVEEIEKIQEAKKQELVNKSLTIQTWVTSPMIIQSSAIFKPLKIEPLKIEQPKFIWAIPEK